MFWCFHRFLFNLWQDSESHLSSKHQLVRTFPHSGMWCGAVGIQHSLDESAVFLPFLFCNPLHILQIFHEFLGFAISPWMPGFHRFMNESSLKCVCPKFRTVKWRSSMWFKLIHRTERWKPRLEDGFHTWKCCRLAIAYNRVTTVQVISHNCVSSIFKWTFEIHSDRMPGTWWQWRWLKRLVVSAIVGGLTAWKIIYHVFAELCNTRKPDLFLEEL